MPKVAVLGGGVAGLSAAHELIERGFQVEVYEKTAVLGGKARSIPVPNSGTGTRKDLPGEHGFRFFPGFYWHLPHTMARIPFTGNPNGVLDNLVPVTKSALGRENHPLYVFQTSVPTGLYGWIRVLSDLFSQPSLGLSSGEAAFFIDRMVCILSTCKERRIKELEHITWWEFIDAEHRSDAYKMLLATGLTRTLVAMKAEEASTRTVGTILIQMIMSLASSSHTMDRVLNRPTSDVWIAPWEQYLNGAGVTFFKDTKVDSLQFDGTQITSVRVNHAGTVSDVQADYYLSALPGEVMRTLVTPAIKSAAPSLSRLDNLKFEWMNGVQFFLDQDVPIVPGHVNCVDSPWALTCISQPQFWPGFDLTQYGDGTVRGIVSVDISEWEKPGKQTTNKWAKHCQPPEIFTEVWAQLVADCGGAGGQLAQANVILPFLDPAIANGTNAEPLLVNTVGSLDSRPGAITEIPNLFLASDYVRTHTDLATMEAANEAARHAVNGILSRSGYFPDCEVKELQEPAVFAPAKEADRIYFQLGWRNPACVWPLS